MEPHNFEPSLVAVEAPNNLGAIDFADARRDTKRRELERGEYDARRRRRVDGTAYGEVEPSKIKFGRFKLIGRPILCPDK